jgi:predicted nucleic acid-binding Zn ribbon protein
MTGRRSPRPLAAAVDLVRARSEPKTLLAAVQGAWATAAGPTVAAEAEPVAERDGVVTIACRSATWAQELDLLQGELLGALNRALSDSARPPLERPLRGLRFTADATRHNSRTYA